MRSTLKQLASDRDEALASLDATLEALRQPLPYFDADLNEMTTRPAATVAGSVNLLDAVNEKRGIGKTAAMVIALANLNLDEVARAAVEGEQIAEVA
ncbi:hypothetical protein [Devosia sp. Root105]|uniref:hypothetical protein n=1 Tax=Devosia sp. Root105 TaxID=1736423 RepID=UPI0006F6FCB2|nr:hypothetical protein [Devosia sp. Root105]KQU96474.1 hypothetical protein ASC68_13935 [Devosia sp. Root105]